MIGQELVLDKLDFKGPYIITGQRGSGKTSLAKEIIMKVICEDGTGCGECKNCATFLHDNYPDYHYIQGGKIDEVREIINQINKKPFYHKHVVLFDDMDKMTPAAQNSLLKTIEELSDRCLFVITGTIKSSILKTIFSRCYKITPILLSKEVILQELIKKYPEENKDYLEFISEYSFGSLGSAYKMIEKKEFYEMLKEDVENIKETNFFELGNKYTSENYKGETLIILDFYERFIRNKMDQYLKENKLVTELYNVAEDIQKYKIQLRNNVNATIMFQNLIISLQKAL